MLISHCALHLEHIHNMMSLLCHSFYYWKAMKLWCNVSCSFSANRNVFSYLIRSVKWTLICKNIEIDLFPWCNGFKIQTSLLDSLNFNFLNLSTTIHIHLRVFTFIIHVTGVTCITYVTSCLFQHESVLISTSTNKKLFILLHFTSTMFNYFNTYPLLSITSTVPLMFRSMHFCCFPIISNQNFM